LITRHGLGAGIVKSSQAAVPFQALFIHVENRPRLHVLFL
jgi:hypothetical protein